ncbi:MAG TPA: Type 1 glutamine amidotransferase-like domain-containing protein [Jatrophihabitantaceae bacterium]|nr:Type 1 glutamine amidotransferase-like domain-containing protein [Jatrophihabitantaceae bacterium]
MAGTVYLGGGGSAADEAQLWRAMLPGKRKVLYWPMALPLERRATATAWLSASLRALGLAAEIETWIELDDRVAMAPLTADLLFVGGGNTFSLLDQVRRAGFLDAVASFVAGGGDYYGGSAGAILAGESVAIAETLDANDVGFVDLDGIGLITGFVVLPHYVADQSSATRAWAARHRTTVLGTPERSGLVVDDRLVTAAGPAPVWEFTGAGRVIARPPGHQWRPRT